MMIPNHSHGRPEVKSRIADLLLKEMRLSQSDIVLDVGSGDGFYSNRFAANCGKVLAVDQYCDGLKGDLYVKSNITTFCENACRWFKNHDLKGVTHVFFSNSFHDMDCQSEILSALSSKLPEGAHLDMIEFHPDTPFGPPKNIRFSKEELKSKVEPYGFEEESYVDLETHYLLLFRKRKK